MTKEISRLTKKELAEFQNAVKIVAKVFDLTEEDVDSFFALVKDAKSVSEAVRSFDDRIASLERAVTHGVREENREIAKRAFDALSTKAEVLNL